MVRIRVEAIDHVEMYVPDQREAAEWYSRVLGLEVLARFAHWADEGPLMISSDDGRTMLALFRGTPPGNRPLAGFRRVAFRLSNADFDRFVAGCEELDLRDDNGLRVRSDDVVDHGLARSIYFRDPWGHRLEVTTYRAAAPAGDPVS
jgi:catechol 2,3-dioxygenase-like lactoylglutathione lyase family enzyme